VTLDLDDPPAADTAEPARRRIGQAAVLALLVVLLAMWWAWPTMAGDDAELDVMVAGDAFLVGAERSMDLRVREEGWTIAWSGAGATSWCDDPGVLRDELDRHDPGDLVLSFADGSRDAACVERFLRGVQDGDTRVVVVVQPGAGPDAALVGQAGAEVADPGRLLGEPGEDPVRACEWWENCQDGATTVRAGDGTLSPDGGERVARVVVAALRA
jgi:hypothetical protein